ncbi:DUF4007 family protein [Jeotgalibacillus sp. ET6]|uniref:DUF4007 family protein n=1 Tax=Jeotgalibacillus sp. ET6 TaxID=3037260 RepID=UPI0024182EAF|nr:DUF4007 family protein [Jeotgalibacillus sp. ET6]MDG5472074.1 DUF4007 family protein [Jeotgalibacillus sp. ET6]
MGFGQHQSFYLRPQWLYKGMREIYDNPRFFYEDDHFEKLGVGKNMAKSVRYWMTATKILDEVKKTKIEHYLTDKGSIVLKKDPHLQKNFTKGLLHYLLVTDINVATTWYWFFNVYNEEVFDKASLSKELENWVEEKFKRKVSINSQRRDIDCLIATYLPKNFKDATPEDVIRSPFEELGLLAQTIKTNYTKMTISNFSLNLIYTVLLIYMEKHDKNELSINELVYSPELLGRVFQFSQSEIVEIVENLVKEGFPVVFTRTNRLDIVRIQNKYTSIDFINKSFAEEVLI